MPPAFNRNILVLRTLLQIGLVLLLSSVMGCASAPGIQARGAVASNNYPNLFAQAGYDAADIRAKLDTAFQQLFYGDLQQQAVYYPDGQNE